MSMNLPEIWVESRVLEAVATPPFESVEVDRTTVGEVSGNSVLEIKTLLVVVKTWPSD